MREACKVLDMTTNQSTFQIGTIYSTGAGASYSWRFEVTKRTAKFITIRDISNGETRRVGVRTYDGREWAAPFGSYSMCPMLVSA